MCGICGFLATTGRLSERSLLDMNERITRRGPDGSGHLFDGRVGLAMRRLSIIDLAGGAQPIFNESRTLAVVFNGEIYNYRQLRKDLERRGHIFGTESDTEVIVHLYEEYGIEAPNHLSGMFAFAIWNIESQELFLARDRMGIKPLYHAETPHGFVFGSEIKSLLASGVFPSELDLQALDEYITYTNIPEQRTIYQGIRQMLPGTSAIVDAAGRLSVQRYWTTPDGPQEDRPESVWLRDVEAALQSAVESHLVSDVPVGAFLSGGVDSGLMVALMASARTDPVETFTVGFRDAGSSFIDERQYSRALAKRYRLNYRELEVEPHFEQIMEDVLQAFDQPFADDSVVPTYYVCQAAAAHVKVALTGLGGDELFGGYKRHLGMLAGQAYDRIPGALRRRCIRPLVERLPDARSSGDTMDHLKRFVRSGEFSAADRYQDALSTLPWTERQALYSPSVLPSISPDHTRSIVTGLFEASMAKGVVGKSLFTDLQNYLVDDVLTLSDRLSMWHSLELRVPYLDHRLVELTSRMPDRLKIRRGRQKHLLKRIAERWLPHEMIHHRKQGFEAPMGRWLRGPLLPYFDSIVNPSSVESAGLLRYEKIRQLRDEHVAGRRKNSKILFAILMLQTWMSRR